jgi:hypothetical protein
VSLRLIKLLTCAALGAAVLVPLTAQARGMRVSTQPSLKIAPRALDFGTVRVGAVKSRSITITNTSNEDVLFAAGWATDSALDPGFGFPTSDTCLQTEIEVLPAGGSCTMSFTFSPVASGPARATFVFTLDGWQTSAGSIDLAARGDD